MRIFPFAILLLFVMHSCINWDDFGSDIVNPVFSEYEPVLMERSDFEESLSYIDIPQKFRNEENKKGEKYTKVGKIYSYPPYIFINQLHQGFHIVDNSDPKNPKTIGFLKAPGSTDLVIKNNVILLNQATDLVSISFQNKNFKVEKRIKDVFPVLLTPDNFNHNSGDNKVVVGFKNKKS